MRATSRAVLGCAAALGAGTAGYLGLVSGSLTIDLGIGRRIRPLGPLVVHVDAPAVIVYEVATAPYGDRVSRAMREKVRILERGEGMVVAAHLTPIRRGLTAVTVESVAFEPPVKVTFRLLRGPVPHVRETFTLSESGSVTTLTYEGELGTDLWRLGEAWGEVVAGSWVRAVRGSLADIKAESERRAAR